jgi:hypothetical protein
MFRPLNSRSPYRPTFEILGIRIAHASRVSYDLRQAHKTGVLRSEDYLSRALGARTI